MVQGTHPAAARPGVTPAALAAAPKPAPATSGARDPKGRAFAAPLTSGGASVPVEDVTGAESVVRSLEEVGVDTIFGIPGGAVLPLYDPLMDSAKLRHILVRHEQGGGHAASGYAHATGRVGVTVATSGPGATNLVTPLADANIDSIPLVAITGQVGASAIGTDAFQEADIVGITMPVTKHSYLVTDPAEIPRVIAEAFHVASTGRPGPVLVDIAKSALVASSTFSWPQELQLPGYHPVTKPHSKQIREAARLLATARRPVLYVGGGTVRANASPELRALVDLSGAPVVTTLMARGALPDSHPQNLGMPGMHGTVPAVAALQKADLVVSLGARFDDRVTGKLSTFAPHATIVHADIDPAEIGKNRAVDVPIVGDLKEVLADLAPELRAAHEAKGLPDLAAWWHQIDDWRETYPSATPSRRTATCRRTGSSSGSASWPARRRSSRAASVSTRCGLRSSSATSTRARGSTPAGSGPWATPSRPRWAPRSACPTATSGRSTATAASR
ncbi:hypothetical protein GCM10025865_23380 [Paraoerskovia sediminicola]|uniref:Acetolactate synthase n=1 Tax=Paraoerskovia sediminicola TaxID=1138587 RepID=A0ABN6XDW7_9CELL|nr:hypothetical protein GCM10025865_23380 [Paraoerskovia sediminicola]